MTGVQFVTTTVTVNRCEITCAAPAYVTLLQWLRDFAGVYDVKYGCGEGVCGSCAVLLDGNIVSSCLVLAAQVAGGDVCTVAGLSSEDGSLTDIQAAFLEYGAAQCGFCTPGMVLAATELLSRDVPIDRQQIRHALHGNLCRCTGYQAIVDAILASAAARSGAQR